MPRLVGVDDNYNLPPVVRDRLEEFILSVIGDGVEISPEELAALATATNNAFGTALANAFASKAEIGPLVADAIAEDGTVTQAATDAVNSVIDSGAVGNMTWLDEYTSGIAYKENAVVKHEGSTWLKLTPPVEGDTEDFNYILNPRFANNRQNWSVPSGVFPRPAAPLLTLDITADKAPNSLLIQQTANTGGTASAVGEVWSTAYVVTNPGTAQISVRADLFFTGKTFAGTSVLVGPGQTVRVTASGTAPTVGAAVYTRFFSGSTLIPAGSSVILSEPVLYRSAVAGPYFDGNTPDTAYVLHEWTGAVDASISRRLISEGLPDEEPSVASASWALVASSVNDLIPRAEMTSPESSDVTSVASNMIPTALDYTRSFAYNSYGSVLRKTFDEGQTWVDVHTFSGESMESVLPLANGEVLVSTQNSSTGLRRLHLSSGGLSAWSMVLESEKPGVKFTSAWSMSTHENIVLVNEYGPKMGSLWAGLEVADGANARFTYLSLDYGRTWRTVFDLNAYLTAHGTPTTDRHLHGVAWDPYWDRIWVSFGDSSDGILYSDNLGDTWQQAAGSSALSSNSQVVGIIALPKAILFGSDTGPSGVMRINRSEGKDAGTYELEVAYTPEDPGHLCQAITRAHREGDDAPTFIGFSSEGKAARSYVVATRDGYDFTLVWRDPVDQAAGFGTRNIIGPTIRGNVVIASNDQKATPLWSKIVLPSPGY